jgi:hypothetical protein
MVISLEMSRMALKENWSIEKSQSSQKASPMYMYQADSSRPTAQRHAPCEDVLIAKAPGVEVAAEIPSAEVAAKHGTSSGTRLKAVIAAIPFGHQAEPATAVVDTGDFGSIL